MEADEIPIRFAKEMEQDEEDCIANFPDLSHSDDEAYTFYDMVNPHLEALCRALEHYFTKHDVARVKAFVNKAAHAMKINNTLKSAILR